MEFNTAIAQMMIFMNEAFKAEKLYMELWKPFVLLLSPYAPHVAEELWEKLGGSPSVSKQPWPRWDEEKTKEEVIELVLQINGKVRSKVEAPADISKEEMESLAKGNDRIKELIEDKNIVKVITVPGKLVNIVAK